MDGALLVFLAGVAISYLYAFVSGFTDAANAIATAVGTRAFTPVQAVIVASLFEMLGALAGTAVALTIGTGIVRAEVLSQSAVVAAVAGAMTWSLLAYTRGIPVSETHGLIGGILGVGLAQAGPESIVLGGVIPVLVAIVASPLLGIVGGAGMLVLVYRTFSRSSRRTAVSWSMRLQRLSAVYMAFSHGRNDAQKPMGVLTLALITYYGVTYDSVPLWVILTVAAVAALGVAAGGWRIIRTLGMRITGLKPEQGFAAETAAGTVLQVASQFGIPISTTHTITSAIVGVGLVSGWKSIRWSLVIEIVVSWVLTLPATIAFGYLYATVFGLF
ncbi:MAG TPA: inorganic phosphate transporter [Candidatus Limnocylindria bacterium]|nr:inorganic phosphate transporter [Candidatus Limnocylindria bacterium]